MIKVHNEINIYEIDGKEHTGLNGPLLSVRSHWNRDTLVVLEFGGQRLTVVASDLNAAIANATRTK